MIYKMIDKRVRKKIVEKLTYVYQKLSPIEDKCILSKNLLRLHYTLCFLLILSFFVIRNKYYQLFILFGTIFVVFTNIIFNGCLITMVEQQLCPGMETVFDWPLDFFGIQVTNRNRKIVTILFFVFVILLMIVVFYFLHIYKH